MARILIVDDEAHIRTLLRRFLEREGHQCVVATSADEAWEHLGADSFELVLSDVNMPGTSGLELAPRIAEEYPDIEVDEPQAQFNSAPEAILKDFDDTPLPLPTMHSTQP